MEVDASEVREAVEKLHSCRASLKNALTIIERFEGKPVWEGVVHVFDVQGHPEASICYAWSSPITGSTKRRYYAILRLPPIESPGDAVRASIIRDMQTGDLK